MGTYAHDTILVKIFGGIFADVRDIGSEFLHSALGVTHLGEVLVDVYGCKDIPFHHLFGKHDGVLVVVSLPRHEGHFQVASESKFPVLCRITFGQHLALLDLVALADDWTESDGSALVGPAVVGEFVYRLFRSEADEGFIFGTGVLDVDFVGIDVGDFTLALRDELGAGIQADALFESGAHNRGFGLEKRNCLTHHVRSHEGAVRIVVLEEWNQGSRHGSHLVRGHVHIIHFLLGNDREIGLETALDAVFEDVSVVIHLHVGK